MAAPGSWPLCASVARRSGGDGWRGSCAGRGCAPCTASAAACARRLPTRGATPALDRVERAFAPAAIGGPDRLWLADISYIPTREVWLYLTIILDGFSRRVVGWATAEHLQTESVLAALRLSLQRPRPAAGHIHHRDRGCRYTSLAFGQQLRVAGLGPSTGAIGDCYDNAVAEAFFASLKVESVDHHDWSTRAAARVAIFARIEVWYKRQRLHSTLGYLSPAPGSIQSRR